LSEAKCGGMRREASPDVASLHPGYTYQLEYGVRSLGMEFHPNGAETGAPDA